MALSWRGESKTTVTRWRLMPFATRNCSDRSKKKLKSLSKDLMSSSCIIKRSSRNSNRSKRLNLNSKLRRPTD